MRLSITVISRMAIRLGTVICSIGMCVIPVTAAQGTPSTETDPVIGITATHEPSINEVPFPSSFGRKANPDMQVSEKLNGKDGLSSVAVTWRGITAQSPQIELRYQDQEKWSNWITLETSDAMSQHEDEHQQTTDLVYVGTADAVQARISSPDNVDIQKPALVVVDSGYAANTDDISSVADNAPTKNAEPTITPVIHTREEWWNPNLPERTWQPNRNANWRGAVVHHTVDRNDYSQAEVKAIIQNIYTFHCAERGWGDIGYNLLVDRFGGIWEGRDEGVPNTVVQASNVEAAHTGSFNSATFGVAVIGSFHLNEEPTEASINAVSSAIAWEFEGLGIMDADGTFPYLGTQQRISGHGDESHWYNSGNHTLCPGVRLSQRLPNIRATVQQLLNTIMPAGGIPVYRVYNPNSGLHHYTTNAGEREVLLAHGWQDENIAFYGSLNGTTVYRLYNPHDGNHIWTMDAKEYLALQRIGWNDESTAWFVNTAATNNVYRLYNPLNGEHLYTTSRQEYEILPSRGWNPEGIAWRTLA